MTCGRKSLQPLSPVCILIGEQALAVILNKRAVDEPRDRARDRYLGKPLDQKSCQACAPLQISPTTTDATTFPWKNLSEITVDFLK
jgi:hypothetical protein